MSETDLLPAVLDSMPFVVTSVDRDGTILFVNRMAAGNLSGDRESLIGTSLYDYFPEQAAATRQRIKQTVDKREVQHFDAVVTLPDGRLKYFDSAYCPACDDSGEVVAIQIIAWDVTEHRRAAQADADGVWGRVSDDLSMTVERVRAILENAPLVISVHDPDTTIRYLNRVLEGQRLENVIGQSALLSMSEDSKPILQDAFDRLLESKEVVECEVEGISGRHWYARLAPLIHDGEVKQVLTCTLDITEQRRMQEELVQRRKVESLGTLARGVAHDFNNLLTAIMGDTGLARRRLARGDDPSFLLDEIDAAARRAADLCEQMLVYAGRDRSSSEPGNLNAVVAEMTPLTRAAVDGRIRLTYDLAEALPPTRCNRVQIGQIVMNLINNAADAISGERGQIDVVTELVELTECGVGYLPEPPQPGHYACLRVTDNGHGVKPEDRQLIFDPFYSTKIAGHGLGLSVVLGILASHGAAIAVDSTEGGGTTMTVLFPVDERAAPETGATPSEASESAGQGTVLVVDDEPAILRMAAELLADAGYKVLTAEDGDAALSVLAQHGQSVRAMLLDVTMPGRDGYATLAALRKNHRDLPVLLSSGRPIELDDDDPFVRILPKPYAPSALIRAIADAVKEPSAE